MEKIDMIKKAIHYRRLLNITGSLHLTITAITLLLSVILPIYTEWYFFIFPFLVSIPILKVSSDIYFKVRDHFEGVRTQYEQQYEECLGETIDKLKIQKTMEEIEQKWKEVVIPDRVEIYEPQVDTCEEVDVIDMKKVKSYVPNKEKVLVKSKKKRF